MRRHRGPALLFAAVLGSGAGGPEPAPAADLEADLLVIGGGESGCAAAVQAARLGVGRVVLVNDIDWLGGQFSAQGVGCVDEWTAVNGRRTHFPRSGLFREVIDRIRAHNSATYGVPAPGNAFCGTETIEPAAAARIFEELLEPYTEKGTGQVRILRRWRPAAVAVEGRRVTEVVFERPDKAAERMAVRARLAVDASDWGDVIRLGGAGYAAGPDLKSRFGEPSAPESCDEAGRQEMNPLSWCVVLREGGGECAIARPATYDPRSFAQLDKTPPWVDSDMAAGIYDLAGWSVYTHRRLVDRWHNRLPAGTEAMFLNWPVQDYPLCQLPKRVADALDATEPGASRKDIVDMTPEQRRIVFDDVKQHALGMLYHLQTAVHDRVGDYPQSFRRMKLTDEFGTPDRLPIKPYIREALRLEALYMLREQDIRAKTREPGWAKTMVPDAVFGFQFNIDFHPTRRNYLTPDRNGPWQYIHTKSRSWHTDTDRAMFPLRGLVPVERDGLLGGSMNIGVSSVVQSALRVHGQMMLVGQASGTVAWMCLRDGVEPRTIAASPRLWREVQLRLVRGAGGPGVLLWPWHDVPLDAPCFEAANLLAVRGIWAADAGDVFFHPDKPVSRRELARACARLCRALPDAREWPALGTPRFSDVAAGDPDRAAIEAVATWGNLGAGATFTPEGIADWATLHRWLTGLGLPADKGLAVKGAAERSLTRAEAVRHLWGAIESRGEWLPDDGKWLQPGGDDDGDGTPDLDDPLPFDRDNDSVPDRIEPPCEGTGGLKPMTSADCMKGGG